VRVWRWAAQAVATQRWARAAVGDAAATVFYTFWRGGSTLALARLAPQRARTAVVTRVHRYELYEDSFDPPFQPWHPRMYDTLALTATISQHGLDYLRRAGVASARLGLFRLGTEAATVPARASDDGVLRIVSCSHVTAVKRVPRIAGAVIAFAAAHPERPVRWTHFGDGPELAAVRERLLAAPANLAAALPGAVANRVVLDHYTAQPVDLFLLLSASEGLPVSIQEAAAAGIPVVATDVGGVGEIVGGDNGVLLASDPTPAAVVRALEQVLLDADPGRRAARREASRRRWAEGFDAQANHTRFAQRLRALLDTLQDPPARTE
jgi:glycosyltransferase involved in cell wall biosynthesis